MDKREMAEMLVEIVGRDRLVEKYRLIELK